MGSNKFILNAEGLGWSTEINNAILEGSQGDILKSASIIANGRAFENAVNDVVRTCPNLGIGLSLNITKGISLCDDVKTLIDTKGVFNNNYLRLIFKAYNPKEKDFMEELEREFRRQIEKALSKSEITHLSSVDDIHSIPKIFDLVCRLAKEYQIPYVRTQFEKPYFIPDLKKYFTFQFIKNIFKSVVLGFFTIFNEAKAHEYDLKTNDYFIGIIYYSMMSALAVVYGVMAIKYKEILIEASINPCRYDDGTINNKFDEYMITRNKKLKEKIENLGFEVTNYVKKEN